jgi:hypothetical protein
VGVVCCTTGDIGARLLAGSRGYPRGEIDNLGPPLAAGDFSLATSRVDSDHILLPVYLSPRYHTYVVAAVAWMRPSLAKCRMFLLHDAVFIIASHSKFSL